MLKHLKKTRSSIFSVVALSALMISVLYSDQNLQANPDAIPGKYIIVFQDWVNNTELNARALAQTHGLGMGHIYKHALKGFSATIPSGRLTAVQNNPDVKYLNEDQTITLISPAGPTQIVGPNRPGGRGNGNSEQASQVIPTGVNRINADLSVLAAIDGQDQTLDVDIAIIDTGIDKNHPDLRVVDGVNFAGGNRTNFRDGNSHGTHVAGTAAARDNGIGVVGVAPGARLFAVRVLNNSGSGTLSSLIAGIDWITARSNIIDVANMSLGFSEAPDQPSAVHDAIRNSVAKGIVYTVAAGNSATDAINFAPASYSEVITISAIADSDGFSGGTGPATSFGADDTFASFSNFGSVVDLAAPGVDILSTLPGGLYGKKSGTSMASPHTAGAAALYIRLYGKPLDAQGVAAVQQGLINLGFVQNSPDGFTGDPDAFPEPLLNAGF